MDTMNVGSISATVIQNSISHYRTLIIIILIFVNISTPNFQLIFIHNNLKKSEWVITFTHDILYSIMNYDIQCFYLQIL